MIMETMVLLVGFLAVIHPQKTTLPKITSIILKAVPLLHFGIIMPIFLKM